MAPDNVWVAGDSFSETIAEHGDGASWEIEHTASPDRLTNQLGGVAVVPDGSVLVAGWYGHDDLGRRAAWGDPANSDLIGEHTLAEVSTGSGFRLLRSSPDGYSWFSGVSQDSSSGAWAVGSYVPFGRESVTLTYALHWDGTTWTEV